MAARHYAVCISTCFVRYRNKALMRPNLLAALRDTHQPLCLQQVVVYAGIGLEGQDEFAESSWLQPVMLPDRYTLPPVLAEALICNQSNLYDQETQDARRSGF